MSLLRTAALAQRGPKTERLTLARKPLAMPASNLQAREDVQAFMRRVAGIEITSCAHCGLGRWLVVEQRGADRAAIAAPEVAACRGPQ